ncbi:ATP-binding protein [Paenibacillus filicis]|uniref:histidine kinase n=1 Tax=Paenibacillus gyeongsangnamensis TaxID=3388067 RepID=A0ABT4QE27_9BACL|nr:ATP-binding protein [Paenibacillus filicis]MCZ8515047.1 ATP-binding protein [Paenibacillus filicis]
MRGLTARIAIAFIGIVSGILLISTITFILETHYHFALYQHQAQDMNMNSPTFDAHFEQALVQSVLWTATLGIALAIVLSLFVARRITAPLIQMKDIAERMAKGERGARTTLKGNDELSELGGSLNFLAEQLEHQEQLRKTMTADVAHELRTPLTTLKSHMEAMIEGVWEPTRKRLVSCFEEIERLRHLVGDLEQLTEMESPHFKLYKNREDISALIQHAVEASMASYERKDVDLYFEKDAPVYGTVDRQRIGQILLNLLSNALKFTPPGGSVSIKLKQLKDMISITVTDTGIGIPSSELPYVLERFYRVDKSRDRKSGGSGIGLTIVQRLVEAHGGIIRLESHIGAGTVVTLLFPYTSSTQV